jgi:hypothetical protein
MERNRFSSHQPVVSTTFLLAALIILMSSSSVLGQTTFGRVSGTITDSAGAAIPNASVTVSNPATNFSRTATTDNSGFYTVTNIPVGTYTLLVEMQNFKKAVRQDNIINADSRLTVDVALETGQMSEVVVEVTPGSGETVNTTSGEVAKVIDNQQLSNLALNGRNYYQLLSLIPGAVATADDALDTNLATNTININGNRGVANLLTVDGGTNNNAGSNASQINNVGIDFIQEVKLQTSNFSAEYGRNAGAQINVITKRGTNKFHGSAFEFLRNDRFDARDPFAGTRPFLRYHNYGWTLGGPLPYFNLGENDGPMFKSGKDKLFFFAGMEWKQIHRFAASTNQTLPTTAELNGDFSFRLRGFDGIAGTPDDGVLHDPSLVGACTAPVVNSSGTVTTPANRTACFGGTNPALRNRIPAGRITADGMAFANVYRAMILQASRYVDAPVGSNATFQPPITSDFRQEFARVDYIINDKHSIYGRYIHDSNSVIDPFGTFINSPLPTSTELRNRPGNGLQFGYLWDIKANLINEFKYNSAWSDQVVTPTTDFSFRPTYGFSFPQLFPAGGQYENSIPNTTINGGTTFASFSGVAATLTALTRDYAMSDNVTWVKGNHTFKFGGLWNFNQTFQNGRSAYAGAVTFTGSSRAGSTGQGLGDALLSNFANYNEASADPTSHFRFRQYEAFALDSWKVTRRLSFEIGLRWQYGSPFYTAENTVSNFDPALYDFAHEVVVSNDGNTVTIPAGSSRFNGLVRAGDGVPLKWQDSVPSFDSVNYLATPDGAPRGLLHSKNYFMPRVGFAYSPFDDGKTSIRGGFGIYYDRIEGNIIFPLENNPPFVDSSSVNNGNLSNISGGTAARGPFAAITTIDPNMETSSSMNFSLGIQHELPWGIFVEATGVGNLGRHLTRQRDINAVTFADQVANAALPTPKNINALRKYKGYTNINQRTADANSYYYAMQLYAAKRKGDLLFAVNYTFGKVMTDANVLTEAAEDGPFNRRFSYGPATFDRRHVFVASYTYSLPFFRSSNGWVKAVLSGYELSGITRIQAGRPFTITATSNIGNQGATRRADVVPGVDLYLNNPDDDRQWLNPAAFAIPPITRLGTSGVSLVTGPWYASTDFSLRKLFKFSETKTLRLEADLFNAFNRNNFSNIQVNRSNADFGKFIGPSGPGRSVQLGIKFGF